jgi:hypothetical protein
VCDCTLEFDEENSNMRVWLKKNGFGPSYLYRMLSPGIAAVNLLLENVINMI